MKFGTSQTKFAFDHKAEIAGFRPVCRGPGRLVTSVPDLALNDSTSNLKRKDRAETRNSSIMMMLSTFVFESFSG
jgi:hypothetical protein